jgi:23S rRNA (uracil1939-C5)-methyltransferase
VPCPFRGIAYGQQLERKRRIVIDALRDAHVEVDPVVGSRDLFGYRNVAKLAVRARRGGGLRAGVYIPGTHRLAEASGCAVHHPAINEVLATTLREAETLGVRAYDERDGSGDLRYVVARYSAFARTVLLMLVTRSRSTGPMREVARRITKRSSLVAGIVQNVNPDPGNVILGPEWATLRAPATMIERIGPYKLQTSPGAFLQANLWTARRIYEAATEWADPDPSDHVLDLFCGVGPLTFHLAARARLAIGIEEVPAAVADARSNARRNGIHNARFEAGLAEEVVARVGARLDSVAVVALNPPRKGARREVIEAIARLGPRRIVYISCNPATLARDLRLLRELGYPARRVQPFDMLPQTEHVEVLALAERE